jgi:hypothetical protein
MFDRRLLGRWRSDKRRTLRDLNARRDISPKAKRLLSKMFGKLEIRFTRTRCRTTLNDESSTTRYVVVAKDLSSVAIVSRSWASGKDAITHIHFENSSYWIHVGTGKFREFFTRINTKT